MSHISSGIRLLGANTDMNEAQSLSHANDIIDIYSNSWGPCDLRCVGGPEKLTQMTLKNGAEKVSNVCSRVPSRVYRDGRDQAIQDIQRLHTQVTPSLHAWSCHPYIYLVSVVLGSAIPTSLNIFGKCFSYLFVHSFLLK